MSKNPCKIIEEYFPITSTAWETASYYNGFYTWLHINKNAVDNMYIRANGDYFSPKDGIENYLKQLDIYDKTFNSDPTHVDLKQDVLNKTKEKVKGILPKIKEGNQDILKTFKKSAQLFSPDSVSKPIEDQDLYLAELSNMGAYYRAKIMQSYYSSYDNMLKTIDQGLTPNIEGVISPDYPYRLGSDLKDILMGAFDNMPVALSSAQDLTKFVAHIFKQDALRFLKAFNQKPLEPIIGYDVKSDAGVTKAMDGKPLFESIFSEKPIAGIKDWNYKNMIRSFEGNYQPSVQLESSVKNWLKRLRQWSGDLARFGRSFLNVPVGAMYLTQGLVSYSFQVISDITTSQGEYKFSELSKVAELLGYPTSPEDGLITRYLADDAGTIYDGGLSPIRKLAKGLQKVIDHLGANKIVGEAAKESILGRQNVADVLFRKPLFLTSLRQAINKEGFTVGGLVEYLKFPGATKKELVIQNIKKTTDELFQSKIGFYLSPVGNTRAINRSTTLLPFVWLNSWGFSMAKSLVNISVGNIAGHLINGIANRSKSGLMSGKDIPPDGHRYDDVLDYIANDPKYHSFLKLMFYTLFFGNKLDMLIDDDRQDESVTQRIMSAVRFGSRMNNFFQGTESELLYRMIMAAVDGYNNPLVQDKAAGIITSTLKQFGREFGRQRGGADMLLGFTYSIANGIAKDGFVEGLQQGWNTLKNMNSGMNRFYATQIEESINKNNVPMTPFDQLSILEGFQINDVKQLQSYIAGMNSANARGVNAGTWFLNNILNSELPLLSRPVNKAMASMKAAETQEGFDELVNKIQEDQVKENYINKSLVPLNRTSDIDLDKRWQDTVASSLEKRSIFPGSKSTFANLWAGTLERQTSDITDNANRDAYKPVADFLLKDKLTDKEIQQATDIFAKKDLPSAGGLYFLKLMEAKSEGAGAVVLSLASSKLRYLEAKKLGYTSMSDKNMPDDAKYAINKKSNELFSPYLAYVNHPEYQKIMNTYIQTNPKFSGDAENLQNSADIQNSFKAWLFAATVGINKNNPGSIYMGTNIGQSINYIKDPKLAVWTIGAVDQMITNMSIPEENKLNLRLGLFEQSKKFVDEGIKDPKRAEEHKDLLQYPMQQMFGTFTQTKQLVDDTTISKTYNDSTNKLYDLFFGSGSSSGYKKYISSYNKMFNYMNTPYVKDFILKNYNGYSNQSYGSKYSSPYRDFVRAVTQLDYRGLPGKAQSERIVREFRSPDEKGLPGGSFTKQSGTSQPYRVGTANVPTTGSKQYKPKKFKG